MPNKNSTFYYRKSDNSLTLGPKLNQGEKEKFAFTLISFDIGLGYNKRPQLLIHPLVYKYLQVLVPPVMPYSQAEKPLMPFNTELWINILVTFLTALVVIFYLNVAIIFFGYGKIVLPKKCFARFILVLFVMFSLVIRTAYQTRSFDLLQQPLFRPEVETVDELYENDYVVYIHPTYANTWHNTDLVNRQVA